MADVDTLLKAWGLYYGERNRVRIVRSSEPPDIHPLARARQFAPGKKDKRQAQHRAGYGRRLLMARAIEFLQIVPAGFVDPVPCKETRSFRLVAEQPVPAELQRVEGAVKSLEAVDLLRGICVRARYCVEGTDADRALWATQEIRKAKHYAEPLTAAQVRNEAAFARAWIAGKLDVPMLRPPTPLPATR